MKKSILLAILVSALAAMMCTTGIHPASAYIYTYSWHGQEHYYDPFHDSYYLTVFPENTNATLMVTVYNSMWWADLNVSAVKVNMDWTNENYSSTECSEANPVVMSPYSYRTFTVIFTVPSTSVASNLFRHYFTIIVEEVDGAGKVSLHDTWTGSGFTVYSTVQKEAQMLYDEIDILLDYFYMYYFDSVEAQTLAYTGMMSYEMGEDSHESGNFDIAKTHYEDALDLFNQAIDTETTYDQDWQDDDDDFYRQMMAAQLREQEANATYQEALGNATMREADATFALAQASLTQGYAWIVFGIGFVIFGVAAVIWANKRPSPK